MPENTKKTDLLGFEAVQSVAREAKNKLWSSNREPCWNEWSLAKILFRNENKQENRFNTKRLEWYSTCYSPKNHGTAYF